MVLHLPHPDGGFGVTLNDITKDDVFYTTTSHFVVCLRVFSQERQGVWLPKDDLKDTDSWSSGVRVRPVCDSQGGVSQQETDPLFVPQLDRLYESNLWREDTSKVIIPTQKTLTHHIHNRLKTSSIPLCSHVALSSFVFTHNSV